MKKRSICYFIMISVVLFCSLHILAAEDIKVDSIRFDPVTATVDIRGGCPAAKDQEQVLLEIFLNAQTAHSFVAQTVCMNGSFAFLDCKLPSDTEPGAYTVRVSRMFGGESVVEDAFFYGGEEAVLDLINIIDQEMSPERLYALILDNYQVLGGDAEALYRQVTTKSLLFEEIISEDLNADKNNLPEKWRRFLDLLNYGTVITAISDSINANQIQTIIENPIYAAYADLDIAGSDGFHIYASLTETGRAEAYRLLAKSTLTSLAEMNDELRKKCFVAHLRIGRYTDGEKAFLAVKDILNTNFSNYNLLTAEQKNEVLRKTAEYAKAIDDPYAISSYFEKETEKAYQTKGQGTDGKTSHSSSGSSGGVNAAGGYPPQTAEPDNAANENISGFQDIQNVEWAAWRQFWLWQTRV